MGFTILGGKLTHTLYCRIDILDEGQMEDTAETQKALTLSRAKERTCEQERQSESYLDHVEKSKAQVYQAEKSDVDTAENKDCNKKCVSMDSNKPTFKEDDFLTKN